MHDKMMPLSGRERIRRTFDRVPVDRFPIDLGAHFSTGISAFAYARLRRHLGLVERPIRIVDPVQFLALLDDDVIERLGCDVRILRAPWPQTRCWVPRGEQGFHIPATMHPQLQEDGSWVVERDGLRMRMPEGGFFFDGGWPQFDERPWEKQAEALRCEADRLRATGSAVFLMQSVWAFFSDHPDWLMRAADDPDALAEENARICDRTIEHVGRLIDLLGDRVDIIDMNGDLGAQKAPMIGPRLYERVCLPSVRRVVDFVHRHSDWKVFMHSCGAICPLLPALAASGIDAINPVQISAQGMDPARLKRDFGDRLVFWGGGCDTQRVLGTAPPAAVRANVRELTGILASDGGFVFTPVHNIMGDVPPENIVAMYDEAYACGLGRPAA
jgi:uroporphyrinogen decarboxylase